MAQPKKSSPKPKRALVPEGSVATRSGTVAVIGRPNVGKSTFLNSALGVDLAIVAATPGTTRTSLLGVVRHLAKSGAACELLLVDTPGLHHGKTKLNQRMNRASEAASSVADVVLLMIDVKPRRDDGLSPHREDLQLLAELPKKVKVVVGINKVDLVPEKPALLGLMTRLAEARPDAELVPISARKKDGVELLLSVVAEYLPEGPFVYGEDDLTDKPTRFFASEFVREQILRRAKEEVPHAAAVSIDTYEDEPSKTHIACTIHVERNGQKRILVGAGGEMLKTIGTHARKRIEAFIGRPVHLTLFVRETPGWRDDPRWLGELGYEADLGSKK